MPFATMRRQGDSSTVIARVPDVVRWAAVIAGVVIGLGIFTMLNALWWAIEYSAGDGWVSRHLAWLLGGSAAVSLLLAGLIAGAIAGVRGTLAGLINGATLSVSLGPAIPGVTDVDYPERNEPDIQTAFGCRTGSHYIWWVSRCRCAIYRCLDIVDDLLVAARRLGPGGGRRDPRGAPSAAGDPCGSVSAQRGRVG